MSCMWIVTNDDGFLALAGGTSPIDAAQVIGIAAARVRAPESLRGQVNELRASRSAQVRNERLIVGCAVTIAALVAMGRWPR
jgi:hypothetical protein